MTVEQGTIREVATMTELVKAARRARAAQERAARALDERDKLLVDLYRRGESPKLLAEAIDLSENQVFKILRRERGQR
jgi:hypothetical protein